MTICTRPSCGQDLDVTSEAFAKSPCVHHPGQPVFHEGQKSWSCCNQINKPVLDFDDFVKIGGCTTVEGHSKEKPKKPEPKAGESGQAVTAATKDEQGREVYGSSSAANGSSSGSSAPSSSTVSAPAAATQPEVPAAPAEYVETSDPEGASIPQGAVCKRVGCGQAFAGGERDRSKETCHYHKGIAIFHEGSKGYTCCKRRVLEFAEFMKIEPCTTSSSGHLFIQPPKKKSAPAGGAAAGASAAGNASGTGDSEDPFAARGLTVADDEDEADCRMDHFETSDQVHLTFYCKGIDVDSSRVLIEPKDLFLSLSLPPSPATGSNRRRRNLTHLALFAEVEGEPQSSFTVSPSKIKMEVTLQKKVKGQSWPTLQRGQRTVGYGLTFGRK